MPSRDLLATSLKLIELGLPIYAVGRDKKPIGQWRNGEQDYVEQAMTTDEWRQRVHDPRVHGIAVLGSRVYRTVILDIEAPGLYEPMIQAAQNRLPGTCQQTTVHRGLHHYILVEGDYPGGATRLAQHPPPDGETQPVLLAERRGHASYAVIVGPGRPPPPADFAPAVLTREQYDEVEAMIRQAGTYTPKPPSVKPQKRTGTGGGTGDIVTDALKAGALSPMAVLAEGWKVVGHERQGRQFIRRPHGTSATSGNILRGVVVIHSTAVDWAEPGQPISGAETLARSRFGGDFAAAVRWVETIATGVVDGCATPPEHWPVSSRTTPGPSRSGDTRLCHRSPSWRRSLLEAVSYVAGGF